MTEIVNPEYHQETSIMEFDARRMARLSGIALPEEELMSEGEEGSDQKVLSEGIESAEEDLTEATIRRVVKEELQAIVDELRERAENGNDASWLFKGMKQPKNSGKGKITTGFRGVGF